MSNGKGIAAICPKCKGWVFVSAREVLDEAEVMEAIKAGCDIVHHSTADIRAGVPGMCECGA